MRRRLAHTDLASLGLCAVGALLAAALYPRLPERMPVHFDLYGRPDEWAPRAVGAFLPPGAGLVSWLVLRLGGAMLPARPRAALARSPMDVVALLHAAVLFALQLVVLYVSLGRADEAGTPLALVSGAGALLLGQVLPRLRRNPLAGIRTPWTLLSDEVWQRTQRFGGYALTLGGLAALGLAPLAPAASLGSLLAASLAPALYSLFLASSPVRERRPRDDTP